MTDTRQDPTTADLPPDWPDTVRVRVHPALCEGWGECHRWAGEVYPLDEEGCIDLHLAEIPPEHQVAAWLGAQACPQGAITLIGPSGEQWIERIRRGGITP